MKHVNVFVLVIVLILAGSVQLASAQDSAPAKKGDPMAAPLEPQGPGGSNTGLDAAYDAGATITVDGPIVTLLNPATNPLVRALQILAYGGPGTAIMTGFGSDLGAAEVQLDNDGAMRMWSSAASNQQTVFVDPNGPAGGGRLYLWDEGNSIPLVLLFADGFQDGGELRLYQEEGASAVVTSQMLANGAGEGGDSRLYINDGGTRLLTHWSTADGVPGTDAGRTLLYRKGSADAMVDILASEGAGQGASMYLRDAAGNINIELDADFGGDGRVITEELQITGGSDLSENFDITGNYDIAEPLPGMVVSIDPSQTGGLTISGEPYDRMVAGVVSGAGGIETGLIMAQKGTAADGEFPVALTGRVYVYVDAAYGEVTPGDLLTTSATPGHAMKATDHTQAQGAILGKAMSGLTEGRGLVLVLVSLQ